MFLKVFQNKGENDFERSFQSQRPVRERKIVRRIFAIGIYEAKKTSAFASPIRLAGSGYPGAVAELFFT